jgi:peptide/nickel transport system substrate-binding protein
MKRTFYALLFAASCLVAPQAAEAQSVLNIGLGDDPGSLDPATNASFVGRMALQPVCDKLVDINTDSELVPMLAESWEWDEDGKAVTLHLREGVTFHDGTPFDAAAVEFNLNRYLTMEGSRRRAEIAVIDTMEIVDDHTIRLVLKQPSVSLLFQFTDRAGMMVSPTAYAAVTPEEFAQHPVCAGPYRMVEYLPQERVLVERYPEHWRADEYHFDQIVYHPIPDGNIRLVNVQSGQLDIAEQIPPAAVPEVEADETLQVAIGNQPAYQMLVFNLANGAGVNPDVAEHPEVREAFSLALDREAINQVVFEGRYGTGNQPFPVGSFWYDEEHPVQPRDVEAARALLAEAGLENVTINLLVSTDPENQQVAQIMQAMVAEAGITLNIEAMEFISMRAAAAAGDFEAYMVGSSGRVDPDLNISLSVTCGTANNVGHYCNEDLDALLAEARSNPDPEVRKPLYNEVIDTLFTDYPLIYLYNQRSPFALTAAIEGFTPYPDGIIRLEGVSRAE